MLRAELKLREGTDYTSLPMVAVRSYYDHAKAQFAHEIGKHLTTDNLSADVRALVDALVKVIRHPRN